MKTFILIAIISLGGNAEELIIDHDLSYTDCHAAVERGLQFDGPQKRRLQNVHLECKEE